MSIMFRTDAEIDAALDALSEAEGVSKQEVLRRAILDRLNEHERRSSVEQAAEEMLDRWGSVLDRLGKA